MDQFFQRLLAEDDPARLATLAEQAPDAPDLSGADGTRDALDSRRGRRRRDPGRPSRLRRAEAEAAAGREMSRAERHGARHGREPRGWPAADDAPPRSAPNGRRHRDGRRRRPSRRHAPARQRARQRRRHLRAQGRARAAATASTPSASHPASAACSSSLSRTIRGSTWPRASRAFPASPPGSSTPRTTGSPSWPTSRPPDEPSGSTHRLRPARHRGRDRRARAVRRSRGPGEAGFDTIPLARDAKIAEAFSPRHPRVIAVVDVAGDPAAAVAREAEARKGRPGPVRRVRGRWRAISMASRPRASTTADEILIRPFERRCPSLARRGDGHPRPGARHRRRRPGPRRRATSTTDSPPRRRSTRSSTRRAASARRRSPRTWPRSCSSGRNAGPAARRRHRDRPRRALAGPVDGSLGGRFAGPTRTRATATRRCSISRRGTPRASGSPSLSTNPLSHATLRRRPVSRTRSSRPATASTRSWSTSTPRTPRSTSRSSRSPIESSSR